MRRNRQNSRLHGQLSAQFENPVRYIPAQHDYRFHLLRFWQKRAVINRLCNESTIWALPYCAYYMSCNLDHVLYNKPNSSDEEKEKNSYRFAQEYKGKVADFIFFISRSDFSVVNGHKESWDFIKQDLHSLERHTNFGLCFYEQDGSVPLLESERR